MENTNTGETLKKLFINGVVNSKKKQKSVNVLFVCSRNKWRSKTAEDLYKNDARFTCKSAGTAATAKIKINAKMIGWADIIFVMENKHRQILSEKFSTDLQGKKIVVLHIQDDYTYMDAELAELIKSGVDAYLMNL